MTYIADHDLLAGLCLKAAVACGSAATKATSGRSSKAVHSHSWAASAGLVWTRVISIEVLARKISASSWTSESTTEATTEAASETPAAETTKAATESTTERSTRA